MRIISFFIAVCLTVTSPVSAQQATPVQETVTDLSGANASVANLKNSIHDLKLDLNPYNISVPEEYGTVEEVFQGDPSAPLVVHIQNAHANYEAQVNIKKILSHLVDQYQFSLIQLEGAVSKVDPSIFQPSYIKEANIKLVDFLMRDGRITGADAFAVETDKPVDLYGIEDPALYAENLKMFKTVYRHQDELKLFFNEIERVILNLGPKLLNPELLDLTRKAEEFSKDKIDIMDYLVYLNKVAEAHQLISLNRLEEMADYPNLVRLMRLYRLEEKLNQSGLKKETEAVKQELKTKMPDSPELDELLSKLDEPAKGVKPRDYFVQLTKVAEQAKVDFLAYPSFRIFAEFLIHQDEIDHRALFSELKIFESMIQEKLFTQENEILFLKLISIAGLLDQYFHLELSREKIVLYLEQQDEAKPSWILNQLDQLATQHQIRPAEVQSVETLDGYMGEVERFYQLVLKRDQFFTGQVMSRLKSTGTDKTILLTGGFHKDGLVDFFKKEHISYIIVNPKIDVEQNNENYLKVILEENAAVGSVFAGTFAVEVASYSNPAQRLLLGRDVLVAGALATRHFAPDQFSETASNERYLQLTPSTQVAVRVVSFQQNQLEAEISFFDVNEMPHTFLAVGMVGIKGDFNVQIVKELKTSRTELTKRDLEPPQTLATVSQVNVNNLPSLASARSELRRPVVSAIVREPNTADFPLGTFVPQLGISKQLIEPLSILSPTQVLSFLIALNTGVPIDVALSEVSTDQNVANSINAQQIAALGLDEMRKNRLQFFDSQTNPAKPGILVIPILPQDAAASQLQDINQAVQEKGTAAIVYGRNLQNLAKSLGIVSPKIKIVDDFPSTVTDRDILEVMNKNIETGHQIFNLYRSVRSELGIEVRSPMELNKTGYVRVLNPEENKMLLDRIAQIPEANIAVMFSKSVSADLAQAFRRIEFEVLRRIPTDATEIAEFPKRLGALADIVEGKGTQWGIKAGVEALVGELFRDFLAASKVEIAA